MPVFAFQSELLNLQLAVTSVLHMAVGTNGVSLLVKNGDKTLALKSWQLPGMEQGFQAIESELRTLFGSEDLLGFPFGAKSCALACQASTLVPRRLFDPAHLPQYFKLLLREAHERSYGFEKLEEFDCYLVWAAEADLVRLCGQYFLSENIGHLAAPLLRLCGQMAPAEGYAMFANLRGQTVQIAVFERKNLVLFNSFDFAKPSDLLYFILLAYKQFDLNPLEIPLTLSGTLMEDSEAFKLLFRYIRPIRFSPLPAGFQLPDEAKALPAHYWLDLSTL